MANHFSRWLETWEEHNCNTDDNKVRGRVIWTDLSELANHVRISVPHVNDHCNLSREGSYESNRKHDPLGKVSHFCHCHTGSWVKWQEQQEQRYIYAFRNTGFCWERSTCNHDRSSAGTNTELSVWQLRRNEGTLINWMRSITEEASICFISSCGSALPYILLTKLVSRLL